MDTAGSLKDGEVPAVAPWTTMVIRAAVVMSVSFNSARGLKSGEVHQHQQNQQSPAQPAPAKPMPDELAANTHSRDFYYTRHSPGVGKLHAPASLRPVKSQSELAGNSESYPEMALWEAPD